MMILEKSPIDQWCLAAGQISSDQSPSERQDIHRSLPELPPFSERGYDGRWLAAGLDELAWPKRLCSE
jgi:hypothetical protein